MESFNKRIYITCNWTACTYGVIERQKKKEKRKENTILYDITKAEEQGHFVGTRIFRVTCSSPNY